MFGVKNITTTEKTYLMFVESEESQKSFEERLEKTLESFFEQKATDVWFNANEIGLKAAIVFHNRKAILVLASFYPSKVNELAEKISEFAEVEVHLAKKDLTLGQESS